MSDSGIMNECCGHSTGHAINCGSFTPEAPDEPSKPSDDLIERTSKFVQDAFGFNRPAGERTEQVRMFTGMHPDGRYISGYTENPLTDTILRFVKREIAQAIASDRAERVEAPDDLIAEARAFLLADETFHFRKAVGDEITPVREHETALLMASFARQREIKAIDGFVERVKQEAGTTDGIRDHDWHEAMRSVAEEMKR